MVQCKEHPGNEDTFSPRTVLVCNLTSRGYLYNMDTFLCPIGVPTLSLIICSVMSPQAATQMEFFLLLHASIKRECNGPSEHNH